MNSTPTVDDLKKIFYGATYQSMLREYNAQANHKLDKRAENPTALYNMLCILVKRFTFIQLSEKEVADYFDHNRDRILSYAIAAINFFNTQPDDDGEFPEGEEQHEDDKSKIIQVHGIAHTFFLDKVCEFYIMEKMDRERLLEYLKVTRMPYAKKYAGQILKLYKNL